MTKLTVTQLIDVPQIKNSLNSFILMTNTSKLIKITKHLFGVFWHVKIF